MEKQPQPAAPADPLAEKVRAHVVGFLEALSPDALMAFVYAPNVAESIGEPVDRSALARGAALVSSEAFALTPRGPDEFSDVPYLWVTPRPPAPPSGEAPAKPDPCWVVRSPDGLASRRVPEGLLVFSHPGFATGLMVQDGIGDFNVIRLTWAELVERYGPRHRTAVLDHVNGRTMRIVPIE